MEPLNAVAAPEQLHNRSVPPTPKAQLAVLRKQIESTLEALEKVQDELIRQERTASVGQLTKGIVDRIFNPLNYITNFSQSSDELVQEVIETLKKQQHVLPIDTLDSLFDALNMLKYNSMKVQEHSASTTRILRDMQRLLKEKSREFIETDLNLFIEGEVKTALQNVEKEFNSFPINVVMEQCPQSLRVSVLHYELGQAVQDLVNNACYAMFEKSKSGQAFTPELRITTRLVNDYSVVELRDNGTGIPKHEIPKLCNPYFTTKPTSKGTGLGLFMTKDIIETHNGSFHIDSQEGEFTLITVRLPTIAG
ncbi:sensor histidine kinase [Hymenobacter rubidus]|uniref:sensor histidine kinase n=1 Tax=Hymenobacter rubidus TaxID=1441626 RepID=UPI00191D80B2|nr:ATP-binding protein [Hymenobacter rubidus]